MNGNPRKGLSIQKAHANNLRHIDVEISAGILTAITGVSGSGKTSLLDKVIYESLISERPVNCDDIQGKEHFSGFIYIEQSVPGTGHTATVGSLLGVSDHLARIYAARAESKKQGFKSSHFISGSRDSRCVACEGTGFSHVSMDFFNDIETPCERCGGTGFRDEVLDVYIEGKSIYDALQLSFDESVTFFETNLPGKSDKTLHPVLQLIQKTGLGHLSPGRSLKTLSTGELQRLKLVSGLASKTGSNTLILLDEPTGGLHPKDIQKLLKLFAELIKEGNTLVCVTHEPLLMASAQSIIELGPGGGSQGGKIIPSS
ncbi:MAG: AAA family ATPase [Bacteroidales bacterium]|nr:AAA family ATPase [Bacteroidales bacterium]